MEVRDPIHGAIEVDASELVVVDHPYVQRLRGIRQTGFSFLPFPGATHTRYGHCIGAMHLAGHAFDQAYKGFPFSSDAVRRRYRGLVRVAALCHDLGHAPFSHCAEFAMPPLAELGIRWYHPAALTGPRRATHEDYTIAILQHSPLANAIDGAFPFTSRHVAALISHDVTVADDLFVDQGVDHRRILSQIISSELDVDRLDYLRRDSYFTGARYGSIDADWILGNLHCAVVDGHATLALDSRAIYAFDHFLLARHHMFLMVYFHHKSVVYEEMLKRYVTSKGCPWSLPADLDAYLHVDDVSLEAHLRTSDNTWARRVVERRPYKRVLERHGTPEQVDLSLERDRLFEAGIGVIHTASTGKLSRYEVIGKKRSKAPAICVLERLPGMPVERVSTLGDASDVFVRYADARRIARLYVAPEDVERARGVLAGS